MSRHTDPDSQAGDGLEARFAQVERELQERSAAHRNLALVIGAVGAIALVLAAGLGWWATRTGVETIAKAKDYRVEALIFELVRTAAAAALLGAFVWGTLNLARAALDQSTRYEKRLIAGYFLAYVLRKFEGEIKAGKMHLPDVMAVFKAWSDSVDSAFTNVKYGSRRNQDLAVSASKDGVAIATGEAQLPAAPKASSDK